MAIPQEIKEQITVEDIETLINEREDLTNWNNSRLDSERSKAVNSFMTNTMPSHIEKAVKEKEEAIKAELNPKKSPAEIEIENLKRRLDEKELAEKNAKLETLIIAETSKAGVPNEILDFVKPSLLGQSEEDVLEKLTNFKVVWDKVSEKVIDADMNKSKRTPGQKARGKIDSFDNAMKTGDTRTALRSLLGDL